MASTKTLTETPKHIFNKYIYSKNDGSVYHAHQKPVISLEKLIISEVGLPLHTVRSYFQQIMKAIYTMLEVRVVPGFVTGRDILVDKFKDEIHMIHLGRSSPTRFLQDGVICKAPEQYGHNAPHAWEPIVVWSLGVLLYQMVIGFDPFLNKTDAINCVLVPDLLVEFGEDLEILILAMLSKNPTERPSIEDIYKDKWLTGISL